jgi:hypothetical protein
MSSMEVNSLCVSSRESQLVVQAQELGDPTDRNIQGLAKNRLESHPWLLSYQEVSPQDLS